MSAKIDVCLGKDNIYIYIYELGSSYTWYNIKQGYTIQSFLFYFIKCEF